MIHLDTNCLIALITPDSPARPHLFQLMGSGQKLAASTIAWSEFLNGPESEQGIRDVFGMIEGRLIPFCEKEAEIAAKLFNRTGRKRQKQLDCFIAATAIGAGVPLVTQNKKDFQPFVPSGLQLA